jgi:hypothetical protein
MTTLFLLLFLIKLFSPQPGLKLNHLLVDFALINREVRPLNWTSKRIIHGHRTEKHKDLLKK